MIPLLSEIRACQICRDHLPHGCRPVMQAAPNSRIVIVGQAPGKKVHQTGIPWNDPSGNSLRDWMGVDAAQFYDTDLFALIPMGFCYPGTGKTGDLPPRPECAPAWHQKLQDQMHGVKLTLLVGQYAQQYYLNKRMKRNLTETVRAWPDYLSEKMIPLPHPSPLNFRWRANNKWFELDVLPALKGLVAEALEG